MFVAAGVVLVACSCAPNETDATPETDRQERARDRPEKTMDADARFWSLIASTTPTDGAATEAHAEALAAALERLEDEEIVAFDRFVRVQLNRAYRWDLWAVAYVAMGGCSDDGFEYFRLWVLAQGKDYFERALQDPQRAADRLDPNDDESGDGEGLLYAAQEAYEAKNDGKALPMDDAVAHKDEPDGKPWDADRVDELFPELAKRFRAK